MEEPRTNLRRPGRLPWIILAAGAAAAGAYGVLSSRHDTDSATASAANTAQAPTPVEPPRAGGIRAESPVDAAGAKALFETASQDPLARRLLGEPNLVGLFAMIVGNLAEGVSPRKALGTLAPSSPFSVARGEGVFVISPDSYSRYDAVAQAIDSIDPRALATAYWRLHAVLESAHRALGYPGGSLDRTMSRALERIENAPVMEGDIQVDLQGGTWVFADARLERLGQVEKHLLRMGPRNTRLLQSKAREIRQALQLPEQVVSGTR